MGPAWRNKMAPNYGRAVGAIGATSLPYAGGASGVAGPAMAAQGMSMSMRNPMSRAPMNNNPMGNQAPMQPNFAPGVSFQQAASNVMMQQPPGANTAMRPLNMPGMQFDANQNAMVRQQRPQLTVNPNPERWGNLSVGALTRSDDQRWSRMARQAGVRPQDMQTWRSRKIAEGGGLPGSRSSVGGEFVGPVRPNNQAETAGPSMLAGPTPNLATQAASQSPKTIGGLLGGNPSIGDSAKYMPMTGMAPVQSISVPPGFIAGSNGVNNVNRYQQRVPQFAGMESESPVSWRNPLASRFPNAVPQMFAGALGIMPAMGGFQPQRTSPTPTIGQQALEPRSPFVAQGTPSPQVNDAVVQAEAARRRQSMFGSVSNPGFGRPWR